MADPVTHAALGYAGGRWLDNRVRAVFLVGAVLPDVLYRAGLWLLGGRTWFCEPTHSPLALIPLAYALAMLFEEHLRGAVFVALLLGSYLHLAVDAGGSCMGQGVILWAFPFSMDRFEFGWYEPEETVYFILPALAAAMVVEGIYRLRLRARDRTDGTRPPTPVSG